MNRKIDPRTVVDTASRWIAAFALAGAVFAFWLSNIDYTVSPWLLAAGAVLRNALSRFSGGADAVGMGDPSERLRVLAGIIIGFIIAPAIFLSSWRSLKTGEHRGPRTTAAFVLGAGLTLAFVVPSLPSVIAQERQFERMKAQNAIYRTKDHLMAELNRISANAYDYWLLPATKGGGERNFAGYRIPAESSAGSSAGSSDCAFEIAGANPAKISFRASAPAYPGSSVSLEVDSTGAVHFTDYRGLFRM